MKKVSVIPEALSLARAGDTALHDVTRGGILEALLEITRLSGVGMEIDFSMIPIPPVVERFARAFSFDPLRMISSGTLAATVPPDKLEAAARALKKAGGSFADVGAVIEGVGLNIRRGGGTTTYREIRNEEDELARIWAAFPPTSD